VSGHVGGTGASPQTSSNMPALPWEMGLTETNQVLTAQRAAARVKLRTDGGLKTGRDIVIAAILGAEEFGIGTLSSGRDGLHHGAPVPFEHLPGRGLHPGRQDAAEVRRHAGEGDQSNDLHRRGSARDPGQAGLRSLDEVIGRTELLRRSAAVPSISTTSISTRSSPRSDAPDQQAALQLEGFRNEVPDSLDAQMIRDAKAVFERREKMQLTYTVRNTHRAVGTRFSAEITNRFGMSALADGHVHVRLRGIAGQSLGAFAVKG
jgi:glutamate synthase (NADPH/NADH) large chain